MTRMNRPRNKHSGGVVVVVVGDTFITPSSNSSGRPSSSGHSTAEAFSSFDDDCDRRPPPPPLAKGKATAPATSRSSAVRAALAIRLAGTSSDLSSLWSSSPPGLWKAPPQAPRFLLLLLHLARLRALSQRRVRHDRRPGGDRLRRVVGAHHRLRLTGTIIDNPGLATCFRKGSGFPHEST